MALPTVTVIIPVLNPHPVYFPQAVESVLNQTLTDLELLVVEAPSQRSAADFLAKYADARVRHLRMEAPTTLVAQRNRGLAEARSDVVALMDADDVCEPDRLAVQVEYLQQHPETTVLGSEIQIIDEHGQSRGYREYPRDHEAIVATLPSYNPIAQPTVMLRKRRVLAAGGYLYTRFPATEDYELWCRLAVHGERFANLSRALLRYRIHPDGAKTSQLRGILRGTLEVKDMYWRGRMGLAPRLRRLAERALLVLPPKWVLWLFQRGYYRRRTGTSLAN
jgi:glycosyltransferase involved in cell wall biosynthesis